MPLRTRLNLLHAALLVIALGSMILTIVLDAAPRARAEFSSMMLLARNHIERSVPGMQTAADPRASLRQLIGDLSQLRHIRIAWQAHGAEVEPAGTALSNAPRPSWPTSMLIIPQEAIRIPLEVQGIPSGHFVISSSASDELTEIWETVTTIALPGLLLGLALMGLSTLIVHQALRPIAEIGVALPALACGDYGPRVAVAGPPELASICRALNGLAEALQEARRSNEQLARKMVGARDEERRELARELHDELGPHLFSARANAATLVNKAQAIAPGEERTAELGAAVLDAIGRIQSVNRRILTQLSPPGLRELGLGPSLRALADNWSASLQGLRIELDVCENLGTLADSETLTVYRVVQESLTNALRHGNANRIRVGVDVTSMSPVEHGHGEVIVVTVVDNGTGPPAQAQPGFGMLSMQERVTAFGGRVSFAARPEGGSEVVAWFPVTRGEAYPDRQVPPTM